MNSMNYSVWATTLFRFFLLLSALVVQPGIDATGITERSGHTQYLRTVSTLRELQIATPPITTSIIPLFLSLKFLDDDTVTRIENGDDELVSTICSAIHEQAAGNQVKLAAATVGVIIQADNNDCEILSTNRVASATGNGMFALELAATQSVQSSASDVDVLIPLVEVGYDRGFGGRAQFLELLQKQDEFVSLQDVGVLTGGTFTPPTTEGPSTSPSQPLTLAPTFSPSISPTARPTISPTITPSSLPSVVPTILVVPSSIPSIVPSESPSTVPTMAEVTFSPSIQTEFPTFHPSISPSDFELSDVPSLSPSMNTFAPSEPPQDGVVITSPPSLAEVVVSTNLPSQMPSIQPSKDQGASNGAVDDSSSSTNTNRRFGPLVIAAIAGGILAVLVLAFCLIRCCCCMGKKDGDDDAPNESGTNEAPPVIPEMLVLDDDGQSLADTTLGEHTAGRKPPKKKRLVSMDSFDDSSLYTSSYNILPARRISSTGDDDDARHNDSMPISSIIGAGDGSLEPSTLGAISLGTSLTEIDQGEESARFNDGLDNLVDFGDDPFFGGDEEEGLLGAVAPSSPLAGKIEDMVAAELDYPSDDSSTSVSVMIGDTDSPLDLSQQPRQSNIIIMNDVVSSGSSDSSAKKLDFDLFGIGQEANETGSIGTRSSMTSKIGNITPSSNESSTRSASSGSSGSPTATSPTIPATQQRAQMSPSVLLQTKSSQSREPKTAVYRSRYLGSTPIKGPQHFVPPSSTSPEDRSSSSSNASPEERKGYHSPFGMMKPPFGSSPSSGSRASERSTPRKSPYASPFGNLKKLPFGSPLVSQEGKGSPFGTPRTPDHDKLVDVADFHCPKTPQDPPGAGIVATRTTASTHTTPQATNMANMITTPVGVRRVTTAGGTTIRRDGVFRSPASLKTVKSKKNTETQSSVSPGHSSSSDSDEDNEFLFAAVERTLGPRSASADVESLSGRSGKSRNGKTRRKSMGALGSSVGSHRSTMTHVSLASEEKSDCSFVTPRTLQHDLSRLEKQLKMLKTEVKKTKRARQEIPTSPLTLSTGGSLISQTSAPRVSTKQRVVVVVPPGKLGVVLANRRDNQGTVVAEVKVTSCLSGALVAGDKLLAVDGIDVTSLEVSEITRMMNERSTQERHLTFITSSRLKPLNQESKYGTP